MRVATEVLAAAVKTRVEESETTFFEALVNRKLGESYRRDAMTAPQAVARHLTGPTFAPGAGRVGH